MAHLQQSFLNIWSWRCKSPIHNYVCLIECSKRRKSSCQRTGICNSTRSFGKLTRAVQALHCCSSLASSSAKEGELAAGELEVKESRKHVNNRREYYGSLVSEHGWHVRMMVETDEEMRKVARVQAEAFHEPVILFDDLFFEFFQVYIPSSFLCYLLF